MALSVERRTCNQEVVGSTLGRACGVESAQVFHTYSPSSISWYRLVMPCSWGVKAGMVRALAAGKLSDPLVTHESYLSALEIRLGIIKRNTNGSFTLLTLLSG